MKSIAVLALVAVAASGFTFDSTMFVDGLVQGSLGWAHPLNMNACMSNFMNVAQGYITFWRTFLQFDSQAIYTAGMNFQNVWASSPRCYYATNVPAIIVQGFALGGLIKSTYDTALYGLVYPLAYAYYVAVIYGSVLFDFWTFWTDALSVYNGSSNSTTLGYIAAFFARWFVLDNFLL